MTVAADYIELHIIIKILHFTGFLAVPSPFDFCVAFMKHLCDTKREAEKTPLHSVPGESRETKAQRTKQKNYIERYLAIISASYP